MLCVPTSICHSTPMYIGEHSCPDFCMSFLYLVAIRSWPPSDPSLVVVKTPCFLSLFSHPRCSLATCLPGSPTKNLLQNADVFPIQECPKLDRALKMYPQELQTEGMNHLSWFVGYTFAAAAQGAAGLCCKDSLLSQKITKYHSNSEKHLGWKRPAGLFLQGCFLSLAVL